MTTTPKKTPFGKLDFSLEREIVIRAPRATVFRYFTDPERFARWWGAGSTLQAKVGGRVEIVYPGDTRAGGEVLEICANERIVFSYGYEGGAMSLPPGGSRVTITLTDHTLGTKVRLRHDLGDAATRDHHVQGWRYHMAVFANVVANEAHAGAAALADRWFAAWNEIDAGARRRAFAALVDADATFHDAHSCNRGLDDLDAHAAASQTHMPGMTIARAGEPRQCQGAALVDWVVKSRDGNVAARGTNLFEFTPDAKIARVHGFWG